MHIHPRAALGPPLPLAPLTHRSHHQQFPPLSPAASLCPLHWISPIHLDTCWWIFHLKTKYEGPPSLFPGSFELTHWGFYPHHSLHQTAPIKVTGDHQISGPCGQVSALPLLACWHPPEAPLPLAFRTPPLLTHVIFPAPAWAPFPPHRLPRGATSSTAHLAC